MPDSMMVKASAKINLVLDVTGKLSNGYHTIESIFQTVGIYDTVSVTLTDSGKIELSCEVPENFLSSDPIPCDERNIAYKTAKMFLDENGIDKGCRIHIEKGIPSQAGMGGGSSDAGAVIYCLEKMTGKKLLNPERLGADVPFFLTGGTAYVTGIGEIIKPIADYSGKLLVVAKGRKGVSTAEAYRSIDLLKNPVHPKTIKAVKALEDCPEKVYRYFGNIFEDAVRLEEVDVIKQIMLTEGAYATVMTGSGSAVFGLFGDYNYPIEFSAEFCANQLGYAGFYSKVCKTVSKSFIEVSS